MQAIFNNKCFIVGVQYIIEIESNNQICLVANKFDQFCKLKFLNLLVDFASDKNEMKWLTNLLLVTNKYQKHRHCVMIKMYLLHICLPDNWNHFFLFFVRPKLFSWIFGLFQMFHVHLGSSHKITFLGK